MKIENTWILLWLLSTAGAGVAQKLPGDFVVENAVLGTSFQTSVIYSSNVSPNPLRLRTEFGEDGPTQNSPAISAFSPMTGPVGAKIEVRGTNLAETIEVLFNGIPAKQFSPNQDHVRVRVPLGATSGTITVVTFDGTAVSSDAFKVEATTKPAPMVTRFQPMSGFKGTKVTVFGKHFESTQEVRINGRLATNFVVESDTRIVTEVPVDVATGKLTVSNEFGMGTSHLNFTVPSGETRLLSFHPSDDAFVWSKKPDSNRGEGADLRVRKGSERQHAYLKFDVSGITGRVVGAVLYLYARDGSDDGGQIYKVSNEYSDNSRPWSETRLTWNNAPAITGGHADRVNDVSDHNVVEFDVSTFVRGNGVLSFAIKNASSNLLSYDAREGVNPPALVIRMETNPLSVSEPIITDFMPVAGPVSTQVTVLGRNLSATSEIRFGEQIAPDFSVDSDTTIFVKVPARAAFGKIRVATLGGVTESHLSFEVDGLHTQLPVITQFAPRGGKIGDDVTIFGRCFSEATSVNFGHREAIEFSVDSDTMILTSVPKSAGTGRLSITTPNGATQTKTDFRVVSEFGGGIYIFRPSDDTFARSSKPSRNYYDLTELRVRETHSGSQITFLKFPVAKTSDPVIEAKVRLLVMEGGDAGGTVYPVSNSYDNTTVAWDEVGINWSNAPSRSGTALSSVGSVVAGDIVEFSVLPAISGVGPYSFAIKKSSSDAVLYSSKEGDFPPELIIKTGGELAKTGILQEATGIGGLARPIPLPARLTLGRNYPNPFNLETTIEYSLSRAADVQVGIFNVRGREVRRLVDEYQSPGFKLVRWDGNNDLGLSVPSGVYVTALRSGSDTIRDKMILQK